MNKCLPLGRKYHRFISLVNPTAGLVAIPFGKYELVHRCQFATQARAAIFEWIEVFYNRERLHSALGFKSPVDFETNSN